MKKCYNSRVTTKLLLTKLPMFEHTRKLTVHGRCPNIFRSLEHNTSLKKLDLSRNSQLAVVDGETVGCAIERMLNVN